jgi:hypothetical protein
MKLYALFRWLGWCLIFSILIKVGINILKTAQFTGSLANEDWIPSVASGLVAGTILFIIVPVTETDSQ